MSLNWLHDKANKSLWNDKLLEVHKSPLGGLGVFAAADLAPDPSDEPSTVLLRVPKSAVLSGPNSCIANLLYANHVDGILALVLALLYENAQGKSSPWYDYIQSLDKDLPCSLWPQDELALLKGTDAELLGATDTMEIEANYTVCLKFAEECARTIPAPRELAPSEENPAENAQKFRDFAAACFIVSSRAFAVDNFHELALVPGADLFNHGLKEDVHFVAIGRVCPFCGRCGECGHDEYGPPDSEAEEYDAEEMEVEEEEEESEEVEGNEEITMGMIEEMEKEEKEEEDEDEESDDDSNEPFDPETQPEECCDILLQHAVPKGAELMNTYGDLRNAVLLIKYGFCLAGNENDVVCLGMQVLADKVDKERLEWWANEGSRVLGLMGHDDCSSCGSEGEEEEAEKEGDNSKDEPSEHDDESSKDDEDDIEIDEDIELDESSEDTEDAWLLDLNVGKEGPSEELLCVANLLQLTAEEFEKVQSDFNLLVQAELKPEARRWIVKLCQVRMKAITGLASKEFAEGGSNPHMQSICALLKTERDLLQAVIDKE